MRIPVDFELGDPVADPAATPPGSSARQDQSCRDEPIRPQLARCECEDCGVHCNAVAAHVVQASCPNCGSPHLVAIDGAAVIRAARH